MSNPQDFRDLMTKLESVINEARNARLLLLKPTDSDVKAPIQATDKFTIGLSTKNHVNKLSFNRSYDHKTNTTTLTPDNGLGVIDSAQLSKIKQHFTSQGKREGKDFKINDVGIVTVVGKVF